MKVNSINTDDISFNGFWRSKALKNTLLFAEKNGALFAASTSLALSAIARPAAIFAAPKTDRENKKVACAKSVVSTLLEFVLTLGLSVPIAAAVGKINKNPELYLKQSTIQNLKDSASNLSESKAFNLANQLFKLSTGLVVAAPKAILNVMGMPYVLNYMKVKETETRKSVQGDLAFKGKEKSYLASIIGKTIDSEAIQDFSKRYKDSNFPMHINALKDILATWTFAGAAAKSKKVEPERKGPLIYNSIISTALSVLLGYLVDSLTDNQANKFIDKFKRENKDIKDFERYVNGFKIAKPVLIMGLAYYAAIPLVSTFFAERIDKKHPIV